MSDSPAPPPSPAPAPSPAPSTVDAMLFASIGALDPPQVLGTIGQIGPYAALRIIGVGGMGVVVLARNPQTEELIALKVLRPELRNSSHAAHRFLTEARHMSRLQHSSIVQVTAIGESEDRPYYTMPYFERGALGRLIKPNDGMPRDEVIRLALPVAEAIAFAHSRGIIHRDLKPANILIAADGSPKVCDFGLVRTVYNDSIVDPSRDLHEGSAPYMSPALAAGLAEDTRCDIYAFGATMYELLTGRVPYEGRTSVEVMRKIREGPPEPILKVNPQADKQLAAIAERCMARELRHRYSSMQDTVDDLVRARDGAPLGGGRSLTRRKFLVAGSIATAAAASAIWWRRASRHINEVKPNVIAEDDTGRRLNSAPFSAFAFSRDGKLLACGGGVGILEVWSVQPLKYLFSLAGLDPIAQVYYLDFNDDASKLIVGVDQDKFNVRIFDLGTQKEITRFSHPVLPRCNFSIGGRFFTIAGNASNGLGAIVYHSEDLTPFYRIAPPGFEADVLYDFGRFDRFGGAVLTGDHVLHCCMSDGNVRTYGTSRGMQLRSVRADGEGPVYTSDASARVHAWANSEVVRTFVGHDTVPAYNTHRELQVHAIQHFGNERYLRTAGADCSIRTWDMKTGLLASTVRFLHDQGAWAFTPDGALAAVAMKFGGLQLVRLPDPA